MLFVNKQIGDRLNRKESMEYTIESAKERLKEVNNCLSLFMKEKRALQDG